MAMALRVVKQSLEAITGQRQDQGRAPQMFYGLKAPSAAAGVELQEGDLWINPATSKLKWWDGQVWKDLVV